MTAPSPGYRCLAGATVVATFVLVVVGGTIPQDDAEELKGRGVAAVFGPGASTGDIVDFLRGRVPVA